MFYIALCCFYKTLCDFYNGHSLVLIKQLRKTNRNRLRRVVLKYSVVKSLQQIRVRKMLGLNLEKSKAEVDKYGREAFEKTISDAVSMLK